VFVRVARFEGGNPAGIDAELARTREGIAAGKRGEWGDMPEGLRRIKRTLTLVDRSSGAALDLNFCETEDDLRAVDDALNSMSPLSDSSGHRVWVQTFEVGIDEELR
jgi:hypothetical protein